MILSSVISNFILCFSSEVFILVILFSSSRIFILHLYFHSFAEIHSVTSVGDVL